MSWTDERVELLKKLWAEGLSASQIATQLGIKPNYMYRVLGELESQGLIRKDGRSYHPPASS